MAEDKEHRVVFPVSPEVQKFIDAGDILTEDCAVDVNGVSVWYNKMTALTFDASVALDGGVIEPTVEIDETTKEKSIARGKPSLVGYANYGRDLNRKRDVRQDFLAKTAGPEKSINAGVKALIALGYSEEDAKAMVAAAPKLQK